MAKTLRDIAPKKNVLGDVNGQFKGVKSSKTAPMNLDAWEKMPDSRDFIAKHEVETHADRVGNGDDVYKGKTKEAKYMRPSNEKLKNDPYDKNMGVYEAKQDDDEEDDEEEGQNPEDNQDDPNSDGLEEAEQLDEIGNTKKGQDKLDAVYKRAGERIKKAVPINKPSDVKTAKKYSNVQHMAWDRMNSNMDEAAKCTCEDDDMSGCSMHSKMAGRNLKDKKGRSLLMDKKKKMEEAWQVHHADGSVENFSGQKDAYGAHKRSSGSKLVVSHGAMGKKAADVIGDPRDAKLPSASKKLKEASIEESIADRKAYSDHMHLIVKTGKTNTGMVASKALRDKANAFVKQKQKLVSSPMKEEQVVEGKDSLYHVSWGTGVEHQVVAKHHDDAVSKAKDALMKKIPKLKDEKYSDTFDKKPAVHNISEVVNMKDTGEVIHDFVHSKNPKFAGKSAKERIRMALGASYAARRGTKKEDSGDNAAAENDYAGPGAAGWTTGRMDVGTI